MENDIEIIDQLKWGNKCAFDLLYTSCYPRVERFILNNNGSKEDAQDIFQETLIIFTNNIFKEEFNLSASLKTYLYSISKNLWLKILRDKRRSSLFEIDESKISSIGDTTEEDLDQETKVKIFVEKMLSTIPDHCQKIIDYFFFKNIPAKNLASELGYINNHSASNAKYKCIEQLKKASAKEDLSNYFNHN